MGTGGAKRVRPATVERVAIATGPRSGALLLEDALERSGFWGALESARRASTRRGARFTVAIKPDLSALDAAPHSRADPALLEHLVDLLSARGCREIAVVGAPGRRDRWLENRDVTAVAERLGYRGLTQAGNRYAIVDLRAGVADAGFAQGSTLHGVPLGAAWLASPFRIVLAKNRTHEAHAYALCLEALLGVVPFGDRPDLPWESAPATACELLERAGPHFCVIDAVVSAHGAAGTLAARPIATHTVIAGRNLLLTDWAGAARMNVDPYASPLNARALQRIGLPARYEIDGDVTPYAGWDAVPPLVADASRELARLPALQRLVETAALAVDTALFPFKGQGAARLNRSAAPVLGLGRELSPGLWALVALGETAGAARRAVDGWRAIFAKGLVERSQAPLGIDPGALAPADFEAVVDYIEPLERLVSTTPAEPGGLRWRYVDGSVLFSFSRTVAIPFGELVARVEIAKAVQYMRDYVGGTWAPVRRDAEGRITHQAERTIYLPQPNFTALQGGKPLDVTKLDFVRYGPGEHKIYWRSIGSENGTVEHDDGSVAFRETGEGRTEISVVARQKFVLPPAWQALNLDLFPWYKDRIVAHEYQSFFRETMNNYEAQYEGRDFRIGRPPGAGADVDLLDVAASAIEIGRRLLPDLARWLRGNPEDARAGSNGGQDAAAPRASTLLASRLSSALGASGEALRAFAAELSRAVSGDAGAGPRD